MSIERIYNLQDGTYEDVDFIPEPYDPPSPFNPIEPAPFWIAAWDLLKLDEESILSAITDEDEQREARVEISKRKTYLRDDPMVLKLMDLMGYDKDQMDTMWLFVQENYK